MALYVALVNLTDGQGTSRAAGVEFEVSVNGGGVPLEADDRAHLAAVPPRMQLVAEGPGPDPEQQFTPASVGMLDGKIIRADTEEVILDPLSVAKVADLSDDPDIPSEGLVMVIGTDGGLDAITYNGEEL